MTKISDYTHIDICKRALNDNNVFNNFKNYPGFTKILEHTSEDVGREYIELIFNDYKQYALSLDWVKLKENDMIGNPNIVNFSEMKNYIELDDYHYSPSTLYYIYRGLDIIDKLLTNNENNSILEIGGGYGGQCKLLLDMCNMLNVNIEKYCIIDLMYVSKLQKKYLGNFKYNNVDFFEFENINDYDPFKEYNRLISIFALSEFEIDVQNNYIDNIIKYFKNYYIVCNVHIDNQFFHNDKRVMAYPDVGRYHKIIINNG